MSRSKKDILDTEKMLERLALILGIHATDRDRTMTQYRADAQALRRISMTLHNWHELECNGVIQRDEKTEKPYYHYSNGERSVLAPDREAGALKRLKAIMARYPALQAYVQGDPRGCALYILRPGDVPRAGYRAAWNIHHNIGCFIRPDDEKSFTPAKVFKTEAEAWTGFERERADAYYSRGLAVYR